MEGQGTSRRRFLGTAAGATGVALGAAAWGAGKAAAAVVPNGGPQPLTADRRGFTTGRYALEVGGVAAGWVHSAEGGHATSDVVNEKMGADHIVRKHLAGVKYEDITVDIGFAMSKAVYDWISASWNMNHTRKDGAIHAADYDMNARAAREFFHALVTETTIPACDAGSKEPAYLTLKFSPEIVRVKPSTGKLQMPTQKGDAQKQWLPSNFRLQIDGLDCTRVSKIEALTVKQKIVENPVGEQRDYQKEPATVEYPNLVVTTAQSNARSWYDWHEDFVIKGNNDQAHEKSGSLTFLSPNQKEELARIDFFNLGIFKASDDILDTDGDAGRVTFSLYCERMAFTYLAGPTEVKPSPTPTNAP